MPADHDDVPAHTKDRTFKHIKPPGAAQPAKFSEAQAYAIQQMLNGCATEHQQKIGMAWILTQASNAYGECFHPTDRETSFALGRAFVGQQIIGIAKIPLIGYVPERYDTPAPKKTTKRKPKKEK